MAIPSFKDDEERSDWILRQESRLRDSIAIACALGNLEKTTGRKLRAKLTKCRVAYALEEISFEALVRRFQRIRKQIPKAGPRSPPTNPNQAPPSRDINGSLFGLGAAVIVALTLGILAIAAQRGPQASNLSPYPDQSYPLSREEQELADAIESDEEELRQLRSDLMWDAAEQRRR